MRGVKLQINADFQPTTNAQPTNKQTKSRNPGSSGKRFNQTQTKKERKNIELNKRVRATQKAIGEKYNLKRRGTIAINTFANERYATDDDVLALDYTTASGMDNTLVLDGNIVVTDRAADKTAGVGHDTYGIQITGSETAKVETNQTARITVTRDTKSTAKTLVAGISEAEGDVMLGGLEGKKLTAVAENTAKTGASGASAYGVYATGSLTVGMTSKDKDGKDVASADLGTIVVTASFASSTGSAQAMGIVADNIATQYADALTGTVTAKANYAYGAFLVADQDAVESSLKVTATGVKYAVGYELLDKAEIQLTDATVKATASDKAGRAYALNASMAGEEIQDITLAGKTTLTGDVALDDGNDTLSLVSVEKGEKSVVNGDIDLGDGYDELRIDAGSTVNGNIAGVEQATFNLTAQDSKLRSILWKGEEFGVANLDLSLDVKDIDFSKGDTVTFSVLQKTDGGLAAEFNDVAVTVSGLGKEISGLTVNGSAKELNGWTVSLTSKDDKLLLVTVTESGEHDSAYSKMYQINVRNRSSLNGTSGSDWMELNNGHNQTDVSCKLNTMTGDDVISFHTDKDDGTAVTYQLNLGKTFDLGEGTDVLSTYQYDATGEAVTTTSIKKVTPGPKADDDGYYQAASTAVNTVELQNKTFANSDALEEYFTKTANVEGLLGQFKITTADGKNLTIVEGIGSDGAINFEKLDELKYTDFATSGSTVTLNAGEIIGATGYTTVDFDGETAGGTVSGSAVTAAKIVEGAALPVEINLAAVDNLTAVTGFTGKVTTDYSLGTTGAPTVTANDATATFDGYDKITAMTAGTLEGAFTKVKDDEATAGNLTKVELTDSKFNYTGSDADDTLTLAGTSYGTIDLGAGDDTLTLNSGIAALTAVNNVETVNFSGATGENVTWSGDNAIQFTDFTLSATNTFVLGNIDAYDKNDVSFTYASKEYTWNETKSAWTNTTDSTVITYNADTDTITYGIPITITLNAYSKAYDGTEQTITATNATGSTTNYTIDGLLAGDTISFSTTAKSTDAGYSVTNNNVDLSTVTIKRSGVDVTSEYILNKGADATFAVTKRSVTLTSASDSKEYDGTALTNSGVSVSGDGWADGEGATYSVTGTQTNAGSSSNAFTYELNEGTKASNYSISKSAGTLEVTKKAVTVTSESHEFSMSKLSAEGSVTWEYATAEGLVGSDTLTYSGFTTLTFADAMQPGFMYKENTFNYAPSVGTNLDNYEITKVNGHLTVA